MIKKFPHRKTRGFLPDKAFRMGTIISPYLESSGMLSLAPGILVTGSGSAALIGGTVTANVPGGTATQAASAPAQVLSTSLGKIAIGVGISMTAIGCAEVALGVAMDNNNERASEYKEVKDIVEKAVERHIKSKKHKRHGRDFHM